MIDWIFDFLGICRKHRTRTGWDGGLLTYICSSCAGENNNYERWIAEENTANPGR